MSRLHGLLYSRLAPLVCVACLFLPGLLGMIALDVGHCPDVWTHAYRVSGILNGDVVARPVTSVSRYHSTPDQNVGGAVDLGLVELSVDHYNGHDSGSVLPESISASDGRVADVPYNNTAVYSPLAYPVQLAAFALGGALGLGALATYYLAEAMMLVVWTALGTVGILALPRYRAVALGVVGLLLACGKFSNAPLFAVPLAVPLAHRLAGPSRRLPRGAGALVACLVLAAAVDVAWLRIGTSGYTTSPGVVSYEVVSARGVLALVLPRRPRVRPCQLPCALAAVHADGRARCHGRAVPLLHALRPARRAHGRGLRASAA